MTIITLKTVLCYSSDNAQGVYSGYPIIQHYIEGVELCESNRFEHGSFILRLANACLSRLAACNWYRVGSWKAERHAAALAKREPNRIVHMLWADRDWGFIDKFLPKETLLIGTFHQPESTLKKILKNKRRLKRFDGIIVMSSTQKRFFLEAGLPENRIKTILHGIDVDFFKPAKRPVHNSAKKQRILFVGNYLRCFSTLRSVCRELVEDNVEIDVVSNKAHQEMFADFPHVNFRSDLSDRELLERYQAADCFLMTVEDATANNGVLEALACGLPIVAENIGGISEYVNLDCARLCEHKNVEEIVSVLRELLACPKQLESMRQAACRRAQELRWEVIAKETEAFYQQVLFSRVSRVSGI